jgi:PAS domain S-box-containing protein
MLLVVQRFDAVYTAPGAWREGGSSMSRDGGEGGPWVPDGLEDVHDVAAAAADIGVWAWDAELDRIWWSPTLQRIFGVEVTGPIDSNDYIALIYSADRELVGALVGEVLSGQRTSYRMEHRFVRPDGELVWVRCHARVVPGAESLRIAGTVQVIDDEMNWRSEGLRMDRMDNVGKLVAGVAHDLNNLLTVMMSQSAVIEELVDDGPELVRPLLGATSRAAGLVTTLLDLSRKRGEDPVALDVASTIREQLEVLEPLVGEGVRVNVTAQPGLWDVYIDPRRFEQVILNLVVNARDAMEGVGDVTIRCRNVDFAYDEAPEELEARRYVCVEVQDSGPGVPEEVLPRIFDMFFTTKQEGKGTGLGLASCKSIIEGANGTIVCVSAPEGTCFKIYLPRHFDGPISFNSLEVRSLHRVLTASLLIIEDSRFLREWLGRAMGHDGRSVWTASSVEEARALGLSPSLVDAVVSDVVLGRKGELDDVRALAAELGAPVVFMSGYDLDRVADSVDLEREVFIAKPFSGTSLLEAVLAAFELK